MIKTERIKIYPASREQMERIIQAEKDDELKKAYGEMLEGCLTHTLTVSGILQSSDSVHL